MKCSVLVDTIHYKTFTSLDSQQVFSVPPLHENSLSLSIIPSLTIFYLQESSYQSLILKTLYSPELLAFPLLIPATSVCIIYLFACKNLFPTIKAATWASEHCSSETADIIHTLNTLFSSPTHTTAPILLDPSFTPFYSCFKIFLISYRK